jgi:hypothetical protein
MALAARPFDLKLGAANPKELQRAGLILAKTQLQLIFVGRILARTAQ